MRVSVELANTIIDAMVGTEWLRLSLMLSVSILIGTATPITITNYFVLMMYREIQKSCACNRMFLGFCLSDPSTTKVSLAESHQTPQSIRLSVLF
jgi:hypothetical protein